MPLWLRRTISSTFILLFVILAPLLALYSMGYRYHWTKRRLEKTGLLIVHGSPSDAVVRIDGEILARSLPARVGGLGPNTYTVRIERSGFRPWEGRERIIGGETTFIENVLLFRDAPPEPAIRGDIRDLAASADGRWASFTRWTTHAVELWLLNVATGERAILARRSITGATAEPLSITWSPRRALLLVRDGANLSVIDPETPLAPEAIGRDLPGTLRTAAWEIGSAAAIIAVSDGQLFRINRTSRRTVRLGAAPPDGPFGVSRRTLFSVDPSGDISGTPLLDTDTPLRIDLPPDLRIRAFTDLRATTLVAHADTPERRVDIETTGGTFIERRGTGFTPSPRNDRLLLWRTNAFELWAEWGNPPTPHLLTRRDAPIIAAAWHPTAPYVFAATTHDLIAIGLEVGPDTRIIPLANVDAISGMVIRTDGSALFIAGTHDGERGLWRLPL